MLPILVPKKFRIIAHRGASGYAPENTLAAFRLAEKMGAREIELDVWLSKDGHIVVCHDRKLDRYGHPGLLVTDLDLEDLLRLDMGSWFSPYLFSGERMLALADLFTLFKDRFVYHIEIKEPQAGLPQKLLEMLDTHRLSERVIVTSFHLNVLHQIQKLAPSMRTGWLLKAEGFTVENIKKGAHAGLFQIGPMAQETDKAMVAAAHAELAEVRAHHVHSLSAAMQAIQAGCDGFTINWPDWFAHSADL
ncbi:MAG: glycerophosphodiester phosphodiesterase [Thermodesulfobacteriota bacterium]